MRVVMRPISRLKPYEMNPRINDAAVEAVARSIQEFGFRQPIVVDTEDVIICGHTRWKAALMLGIKKVPVHVAKDLTPKQVRAYRIADNKLADLAERDMDLLPLELVDLQSDGVDLGLLGFSDDDLTELFGDITTEGETDPDAIPTTPKKAKSKLGKLYQLGDHRVLCGDALVAMTDMKNNSMDAVITDPPYGLDKRLSTGAGKHAQSRFRIAYEGESWDKLVSPKYFEQIYRVSRNQIMFGANYYSLPPTRGIICWDKKQYMPTFSRWEYIWTSFDIPARMYELRNVESGKQHATQKPIAIMVSLLCDFTKEANHILDPFLGSGTTLIAAEQLGRICYGIEIEPRYVDVTRRRWAEFVHGKGCNWVKLTPEIK